MKIRTCWIKATVFVMAMLVAAAIFSSCGKETKPVTLPDFTDYTQNDIVDWSVQNGVADRIHYVFEHSDTVPADYFIRASLEAGSTVDKTFDAVISLGTTAGEQLVGFGEKYGDEVVMPNVIGMTLKQATEAIRAAGFKEEIVTIFADSSLPSNTVIHSNPAPGSAHYSGMEYIDVPTRIVLTMSDGGTVEKSMDIEFELDFSVEPIRLIKVYVDDVLQDGVREVNEYSGNVIVTVKGCLSATVRIEIYRGQGDGKLSAVRHFKVDFETGAYSRIPD